jgi:signal transduction histidine kinase
VASFSTFKYSRVIAAFAAVLFFFLIAADAVIVSHQRRILSDVQQHNAQNELDLIGTLVREALLKHDYRTVEDFLGQWSKEHDDVLEIRAVTPNRFVLAEYKKPLSTRYPVHIERDVIYEGQNLISLELIKDFTAVERSLDMLTLKLIVGSVLFVAGLGILLWYTMRSTAMKPLEREIAERKKAEKALQRSEEDLKMILDSIHAGVILINPVSHEIVDLNSFAARMIGAPKEQIVGSVCHRFLCPAAEGCCPITDAGEVVDNSERVLINNSGGHIPILKSVVPVSFRGELFLIESFIDISRIKDAEDKLQKLNRELSDSNEGLHEINEDLKNFAYIISHDMRAPLVNIKGFSQELRRSVDEIEPRFQKFLPQLADEDRKKIAPILKKDIPEALTFIATSATRMDSLISAILKLSRAGRRKLNPERLQMEAFVRGILGTFAHQIESHKIAVTLGPLPDLTADRTAMEQIFANLLDNAIKYLDPVRPGTISIAAEFNESESVFHVRDNGRGIAEEDIPRAFEVFRRVGKQDVPGEGMGLAYVKTLVRLLGGRIWCESEHARGSVFSFTIPHDGLMPNKEL